ncbi:MAG: McrC family protein [Bacteroidaceae bacterium]|nr:McrC family protein [Bacteroidaceae bacterium]
MTTITIPDNCINARLLTDEQAFALNPIANKSIKSVLEENPGLLVFPKDLGFYSDGLDDRDSYIAKLDGNYISTTNMVGFVECNGFRLRICSRFDSHKDKLGIYTSNDQFFMYMLSKVLSINIFDMNLNSGGLSAINLLLLLFPSSLKAALAQGVYKEYQQFDYNDTNVRGVVNIPKHIAKNIPFSGNIAYSTRNHSYDNSITELIRHTIEYASTKPFGKAIMSLVRDEVAKIKMATPKYEKSQRRTVINKNLKPKIHPYFSKYKALQELCLQILRYESESYGENRCQMKGIVFNAAWLWEEYLNTLLSKQGYRHPMNKEKKGGLHIFEKPEDEDNFEYSSRNIFPDFYSSSQVMDAKYKPLDRKGISRNDLYQVVTYMHSMKIDIGGFISPGIQEAPIIKKFKLTGYGGYVYNIPMRIPLGFDNPTLFRDEIILCEKELLTYLKKIKYS